MLIKLRVIISLTQADLDVRPLIPTNIQQLWNPSYPRIYHMHQHWILNGQLLQRRSAITNYPVSGFSPSTGPKLVLCIGLMQSRLEQYFENPSAEHVFRDASGAFKRGPAAVISKEFVAGFHPSELRSRSRASST